ncbi:transcriptional regulator [Xanthomonas arboricola]|uniref:transcriptional regulator n=1 Tax=Xanthomonas arboricola TaxID=56448 RepID=UPI001E40A372|nr:YdaS family helix-turn-helix protein [Xanthomonas arboricola]
MNPVEHAIEILGSAAALARACHQKPQAITRWRRSGRVPAHHAAAIESATGGEVTRHALRPDVFGTENEAKEVA